MKEGTFTSALLKQLKERNILCFKIHGHAMQQPGIPDFYMCHNGLEIWVEVKAEGGKLSLAQQHLITQMRANGATVFVLTYIERVDGTLLVIHSDGCGFSDSIMVNHNKEIGAKFMALVNKVHGVRETA